MPPKAQQTGGGSHAHRLHSRPSARLVHDAPGGGWRRRPVHRGTTRSGGNRFKGGAWEYNRNEGLDANNYFLKQRGIAKAPLDYNNFGYRFEGPLQKNKLFFFVGQEWRSIRRFTDAARRTLPTRAERQGDFSGRSVTLRDPLTGQPFPGNRIPADRITADGQAIAAVYDATPG